MPSVISPVEKYYTIQLCVYVLCGSERSHTGLLTAVTFGAKRKNDGLEWGVLKEDLSIFGNLSVLF